MRSLRMTLVVSVMIVLSLSYAVSSSYSEEINLPKTGQTSSYATGDDGDLQEGVTWPSPRFQDMNNGTIRDNLTGLIWLKDGNCTDTVGGINKSSGTLTWTNALTWTNNLASGNCGLTDGSNAGAWRLPNINELKSLVNVGFKEGGFCDGSQCDSLALWLSYRGFENVEANYYWSSTTYTVIPDMAWITHMAIGNTGGYGKTELSYVLPVRGGQDGVPDSNYPANIPKTGQTSCYDASGNVIPCTGTGQDGELQKGVTWPSPRFIDNNNGTVTDKLTGLIWLKNAGCSEGKTWAGALTWANGLAQGSCELTDGSTAGQWRLPNLNELVSLMNFGASNMAGWLQQDNIFTNVAPAYYFWTSSTSAGDAGNAWYTAMAGGAISTIAKTNNYYAWPVKSSCEYPPSGMISWWRAEDSPHDSKGTNHGILMNGATYAPGKVGKAFSFDGVYDYIKVPDSSNWDFGTGDFTIDAWIKTPPTIDTAMRVVSAGSEADGVYNVWTFGYGEHSSVWGTGKRLNFAVYDNDTISHPDTLYKDFSSDELTINPNEWYHIAVVRSGTEMKFYLNGEVKKSLNIGNISINGGSSGLLIGARYAYNANDIIEYAKGYIDEVEIFNRALTASEIQSIYLAGSAGKCFTPDTTPDAFTFTDQTNVPISTDIISNPITVSGINSPATIVIESCTSTSCSYQVNNGSWVSTSGTVLNGDIVKVKQTSSSNPSTTTNLELIIGGVGDTFSVTTQGPTKNITVSKSGSGASSAIVTSIPSGMNCGGTCVFGFTTGSKVTLLFSPTPSWIQVGGNPSISGTNALTIRELNADTTITVNFP